MNRPVDSRYQLGLKGEKGEKDRETGNANCSVYTFDNLGEFA